MTVTFIVKVTPEIDQFFHLCVKFYPVITIYLALWIRQNTGICGSIGSLQNEEWCCGHYTRWSYSSECGYAVLKSFLFLVINQWQVIPLQNYQNYFHMFHQLLLVFFLNCLNAKSLFVLYLIENVKKQFTKKQLTYSWSLLSNLRKRTVRIMTNINNTTKVIRTCGVSVIRSRKFPNMALKSIAAGAIKSVFDAKVPKNVLLNFIWFPSALSIF